MKKKTRVHPPSSLLTDLPVPKERLQHGKVITENIADDHVKRTGVKRLRETQECRIDTYYERGIIDDAEHEAGIKFRCSYVRVHFGLRVGNSVVNPQMGEIRTLGYEAMTLAGIASQEFLNKIYEVLSPAQKQIVISVCGHDEFAKTTARQRTLKRALHVMAERLSLI